jgi:photosystem II stability/assembly factor-like uncharacterized protein
MLNGTIFAGTYGGGLYASTDNGTSWTSRYSEPQYGAVTCLAVEGGNFYAGTTGGLLVSTDSGVNWTPVAMLKGTVIEAILIHGAEAFLATNGRGVLYSNSHGSNWTEHNHGLINSYVLSLGADHNSIYAGTYDTGICKSEDSGLNWEEINEGLLRVGTGQLLIVGSAIYAAGEGVYVSTDNGAKWKAINEGLGINSQSLTWALANCSGGLIAGTSSGIYKSSDAGSTWTQVNQSACYSLAVDGINCYAGLFTGILRSTDAGGTWATLTTNVSQVYSLFTKGNRILAGVAYSGIYLSTDKGQTWTHPSMGTQPATLVTIDWITSDGTYTYAAGGSNGGVGGASGVFRSSDDGSHWTQVNSTAAVNSIVVTREGLFAGCDAVVLYSSDKGLSWSRADYGLPTDWPFQSFQISSIDEYLLVSSRSTGVWRCSIPALIHAIPTLNVSTSSGYQAAAAYVVDGHNFTPNGMVDRYLQLPGQSWTKISSLKADPSGNIQWSFSPTCQDLIGDRSLYGIDATSKRQSNTIVETVVANANCQGAIAVTSPQANDRWYKGTSNQIRWNSAGFTGNVSVRLLEGGLMKWESGIVSNNGSYNFVLPCGLPDGTDYRVLVTGDGPSPPSGYSTGYLEIATQLSNNPCAGTFRLSFPLQRPGDSPYTTDIWTVFDHSMTSPYSSLASYGIITDFVGETGTKQSVGTARSCDFYNTTDPNTALYGYYRDPAHTRYTEIRKYANYVDKAGANCFASQSDKLGLLYYDNHPGYDYPVPIGTPVYATADGKVSFPGDIDGDKGSNVNALRIQHTNQDGSFNGYWSEYLHMSTYSNFLPGTFVKRGTLVGQSGDKGAEGSPHLHFQLLSNLTSVDQAFHAVDPYGWAGTASDPYAFANNPGGSINLWEHRDIPYYPHAIRLANAVGLFWIYDGPCNGRLDHFNLSRRDGNGNTQEFTFPVSSCSYHFYFADASAQPGNTYSYYVQAHYTDGSVSGMSEPAFISYDISPQNAYYIYPEINSTSSFVVPSPGLYQVTLKQPSLQAQALSKRATLQKANSNLGGAFPTSWELYDSSGQSITEISSNIGNRISTQDAESFVVAFDPTQTGIWNLTLRTAGILPIGNSVIITGRVDTTTQPVLAIDRATEDFGIVPIGATVIDSLCLSNMGNISLRISWHYEGPSQINVRRDSAVLNASQSQYITLGFSPSDTTIRLGKLVMVHNGPTSPDTLLITGSGANILSINVKGPAIPGTYFMEQNYPNPFNPTTTIRYGLPERSMVTLIVYNTLGQQVAQLASGEMESGYHEVKFDGAKFASGVYFYRIRAGSFVQTKKFVSLR